MKGGGMRAELTFRVLLSQGLILFFDLVPTVLILLSGVLVALLLCIELK